MSLLDLLIVLAFFILVTLAKIAMTPFSLAVLVGILCVERVLKRETL